MTTDILAELAWRGLIHQSTDAAELAEHLRTPRTMYIGFDPTAESLHVGSFMQLMTLRRFQAAGHRPIALLGGATGMIGDPSGKSDERNLLSLDALRQNVAGIERQLGQFLDFEGSSAARVVNNFDWMKNFSYLDFLRDVGKNFPVGMMLAKDSVRSRLERSDVGLSYTEFSYMLLQAYDFVYLNEHHQCTLQVGGSDQWGNITAGIDLGRRMRGAHLHGITGPLLTKSDGTKMGKTEKGAIWLSAERTSPYQFYQYWLNVADEDTGRCLRYLTDLSQNEILQLDHSRQEAPHLREGQKKLAESLTNMVHGRSGLQSALRATEVLFGGAEVADLDDRQLLDIFADVPSRELSRDRLAGGGLSIVDALVESGLAKSKGDARRVVEQGGAFVNNRRLEAMDTALTDQHLASETVMVLRRGKKNYALLRFRPQA